MATVQFHSHIKLRRTDNAAAAFLLERKINTVIINSGFIDDNLRDCCDSSRVGETKLFFLIVYCHTPTAGIHRSS